MLNLETHFHRWILPRIFLGGFALVVTIHGSTRLAGSVETGPSLLSGSMILRSMEINSVV